jgi:nucleoside-diphosphate-sugar epimerase
MVTGASGTLGRATATALRARGATVCGLDLVTGDGVIPCDVRDQNAVAATVVRALTATHQHRDTACAALGRFELAAARHLPGFVDAVIRHRLRREVASGGYTTAPLAAAMRNRLGF